MESAVVERSGEIPVLKMTVEMTNDEVPNDEGIPNDE